MSAEFLLKGLDKPRSIPGFSLPMPWTMMAWGLGIDQDWPERILRFPTNSLPHL